VSEQQRADLDELWATLEPHIAWPRGLAMVLLFAGHPQPVDALRERAQTLLRRDGRELRMHVARDTDDLSNLVDELLAPPNDELGALWIELWRGSGRPGWDAAVSEILRRLNEHRVVLERDVGRPTVLVLPPSLRSHVYVLAPDLWAIRSYTAELPSPPGVAPARLRFSDLLRPFQTRRSREESEWAQLLARGGDRARVDPRDGIRALDAAMAMGNLANARRIGLQVLTLILRGHVDEDSSLTTDELIRRLDTIVPASPEPELVVALSKLAGLEVQTGDLARARALYQRAVVVSEARVDADPSDARARRELLVSLIELGKVELLSGQLEAARTRFQRGLEMSMALVSANPGSALAFRDLSVALEQFGDLEDAAGNVLAAQELFERVLEAREDLVRAAPYDSVARRELSSAIHKLGLIELDSGNLTTARELLQRALDIRERFAGAAPSDPRAALDLLLSHSSFIELGRQLEDAELQREHLEAAESLLARFTAGEDFDEHTQLQALSRHFGNQRARLET
jgi:tetratricopeptide (TPR) repeat protein